MGLLGIFNVFRSGGKFLNILIMHAHSDNRGDEAAIKAMVASMFELYPDATINVFINGRTKYPRLEGVNQYDRMPIIHSLTSKLDFIVMCLTGGRCAFSEHGRIFLSSIANADIVVHAPGGPS